MAGLREMLQTAESALLGGDGFDADEQHIIASYRVIPRFSFRHERDGGYGGSNAADPACVLKKVAAC
jgi:hypothetical protein